MDGRTAQIRAPNRQPVNRPTVRFWDVVFVVSIVLMRNSVQKTCLRQERRIEIDCIFRTKEPTGTIYTKQPVPIMSVYQIYHSGPPVCL
jgi:hypothetical protein